MISEKKKDKYFSAEAMQGDLVEAACKNSFLAQGISGRTAVAKRVHRTDDAEPVINGAVEQAETDQDHGALGELLK